MNTPTQDERGGWTSASNAEADSLCQGRHLAQRGLPDTTSDDAASGNRIHEWLAGDRAKLLPSDEQDLADKCGEILDKLKSDLLNDDTGCPVSHETIRETRLWTEVDGIKHSGKPDVVIIFGNSGLIIDWKTGRNEVAEAATNLQLRDLAVMAAETHGLESVIVAVIQPWVTMTPQVCRYELRDLVLARTQMESRIIASNAPGAKRTPGEKQCRYCKAAAACPEAREMALTPPLSNLPTEITPAAIAATLTGPTLAAFLVRATFAKKIIEACEDEAKRRLAAGEDVPGYKLKDGSIRESITDAQECWRRACSRGMTVEQFMAVVTIAKGKLKDAVKVATGAKGKALDADMDAMLADITESKRSSPALVKCADFDIIP